MVILVVTIIVSLGLGARPDQVPASDVPFLCVQGLILVPISLVLLTYGPAHIPATEVSLLLSIETILSPFLVWLAGFEKPPALSLYCGIALISSLTIHR